MPAVGSSISNSRGSLASAMASSTPLDVAISELAARPVGGVAHADLRRANRARARDAVARRGCQRPRSRRACESSAICTFSATVIEPKVAATWKVRPTPSRQISRGAALRCRCRRAGFRRASGASWPLIMLKQVDLPAPFGPIMREEFAGAQSRSSTSSTACTPPKDLRQPVDRRARSSAASCARALREGAGDALRESEHQQQDDRAEQRAPVFGLPHHRVLQHGERGRADDRPVQRLDAAEQHHHEAVDRAADVHDVSGEIEPLAKANSAAGDAANAAGEREAEPVHALDVDADRFGAQRLVAAGAHRIAERREQQRAAAAARRATASSERQQVVDAGLSNGAGGQTPITPFEPPVSSSHWNTIAQTICAKASVSIAR